MHAVLQQSHRLKQLNLPTLTYRSSRGDDRNVQALNREI